MFSSTKHNSTVQGSLLLLFSSIVLSIAAAIYHFGATIGFSSMQLLVFRSICEIIFSTLSNIVTFNYPSSITRINATSHLNLSTSTTLSDHDHNSTSHYKCQCKTQQLIQQLHQIPKQLFKLVILRGIIGSFSTACYIHSMTILPLSTAQTIFSTTPIIGTIMAYIFLNEPISKRQIFSVILTTFGVILIVNPSMFGIKNFLSQMFWNTKNTNTNTNTNIDVHYDDGENINSEISESLNVTFVMGYISAFLGAFTLSISLILIRKAKDVNATLLVLSHGVFALITAVVFYNVFQLELNSQQMENSGDNGDKMSSVTFYHLIKTSLMGYDKDDNVNVVFVRWIVIFGVCICGYVGNLALSRSVQMIPTGLSIILKSSEIIWSYICQIIFFNVIPNGYAIFGSVCIIISLINVAMQKLKNISKTSKISDENEIEIIKVTQQYKLHGIQSLRKI